MQADTDARLLCPSCGSNALTLDATDKVDEVSWVNHSLTCDQCHNAHQLALVGAFGHVVLRWLDD